MTRQCDDNTLILGGFKFSKMQNRRKGILVSSIDPEDQTTSVVVSSSREGSQLNGSNHGNDEVRSRIQKRDKRHERVNEELEANGLLFCRIANKLMQKQNSSTFMGYEVIYKMVSSGLSKNRAEALALGKELSKKLRLFYRVEFKRNTFSDDGKLYKFRPEVLLSVITKSPMCIQKIPDVEKSPERLKTKPTTTSDMSYSPMKFRKFVEPSETKDAKIPMSKLTGKPKKKGRRPSIESISRIPQDQTSASEEEWKEPVKFAPRSAMNSIHESQEYNEDDDQSIFTEITASEHTHSMNDDAAAFPSVPSIPQLEEEEASYMEFTVSTRSRESYFEEFTLEDEDEYDIMSVPTTPVVRQKLKVKPKVNNIPANDLFSPNDVAAFDKSAPSTESQQSAKTDQDLSLSTRMRRGDLAIEVPYVEENDEDAFIIEDDL